MARAKISQNFEIERRRGKKNEKIRWSFRSKNHCLQRLKLSKSFQIYKIRNLKLFLAGFNGQTKKLSYRQKEAHTKRRN
jgi:hypothetical protein